VIATALGGAAAAQVIEGERTFDLVVIVAPKAVSDLPAIRQIPVFGSNGERLTLGSLASVEVRQGFAQIWREENARRTAVKFSVRGRDLGSLVTEAKQKVAAQIIRPPGYRLEWTGEFKNQQRAMKQRSMIAPLSVLIFAPRFDAFKSVNRALLLTGIS